MQVRILDLDGALVGQRELLQHDRPALTPAQDWGPRIRLACSFHRFQHFESALEERWPAKSARSTLVLYGSGDFHHVTLALLRRQQEPFHLLLLDNHPDWMRGIPFLHCGTWLYHAARLPQVQRIFHVGGDVDFDNSFRWLAPWPDLLSEKIVVWPSHRRYERGGWRQVPTTPLGPRRDPLALAARVEQLLEPFLPELGRYPLYISVDKDVFDERQVIVNWDSGHLKLSEGCIILDAFVRAAQGRLAGMDLLGDWSRVKVQGLMRRWFHYSEHPPLDVDPEDASERNQEANRQLIDTVLLAAARSLASRQAG